MVLPFPAQGYNLGAAMKVQIAKAQHLAALLFLIDNIKPHAMHGRIETGEPLRMIQMYWKNLSV